MPTCLEWPLPREVANVAYLCLHKVVLVDGRFIPIAVIVSYDGDERLNDGDHVRS